MAEPRPTEFPEYARNDVVDPTSGVNNVVEPSEAKKDLGHGPSSEFPPRQYMNWLHRLTYKWLKYFDEGTPQNTVELSGTTSTGDNTIINLPSGFTSDNTHVLSVKILVDSDPGDRNWHCTGFYFSGVPSTIGSITKITSSVQKLIITYPNNGIYHNTDYKVLIAKKPT